MDFFLFVQRKNFHQHSISLNFDTEKRAHLSFLCRSRSSINTRVAYQRLVFYFLLSLHQISQSLARLLAPHRVVILSFSRPSVHPPNVELLLILLLIQHQRKPTRSQANGLTMRRSIQPRGSNWARNLWICVQCDQQVSTGAVCSEAHPPVEKF